MQVKGSAAVVVGGTGGMGEATVRRLVSAGASVVIADVADDKGAALVQELGSAVRYAHVDASDEAQVNAALDAAVELGPLRAVIDVHGGRAAGGRLVNKEGKPLDLEGFRATIESYLVSFFNVLRLSAAAMGRQEPDDDGNRGVIIMTASIAGFEGQIGQVPYSAAKGGIIGMTLVAARDLAAMGIRVLSIAPGTVLTPAYGAAAEQLEAHWGTQVPFPRRMGRPGEYALLVQQMIENDYLNGEVVRLDGALRFAPK